MLEFKKCTIKFDELVLQRQTAVNTVNTKSQTPGECNLKQNTTLDTCTYVAAIYISVLIKGFSSFQEQLYHKGLIAKHSKYKVLMLQR